MTAAIPEPSSSTELRHPYHNYALSDAMSLGAQIIAGPFGQKRLVTTREALTAVRNARKKETFNWITGRVAEEVLRAALGEKNVFTP